MCCVAESEATVEERFIDFVSMNLGILVPDEGSRSLCGLFHPTYSNFLTSHQTVTSYFVSSGPCENPNVPHFTSAAEYGDNCATDKNAFTESTVGPLHKCSAKFLNVLLASEDDEAKELNPLENEFSPEPDQSVQP